MRGKLAGPAGGPLMFASDAIQQVAVTLAAFCSASDTIPDTSCVLPDELDEVIVKGAAACAPLLLLLMKRARRLRVICCAPELTREGLGLRGLTSLKPNDH